MSINKTTWRGDILLLITAIVWGGGFIGVAKALDTLGPFYMIAIRFLIASILMGIVFGRRIKKTTKKDIIAGTVSGLFLFLGFAGQTVAAEFLNVGKLAFLTALNVLIVPFLSYIFFQEDIKKYNMIASIIAIIGFGFLNLNAEMGFNIGIGEVLAILGAIFFAGQITALGHYTKQNDVCLISVFQMLTCCILGFVCSVIFEEPPQNLGLEMLIPVGYLGVFSTFLASYAKPLVKSIQLLQGQPLLCLWNQYLGHYFLLLF